VLKETVSGEDKNFFAPYNVKYVKKDHYTLLQKQESLPSMDEN
jgi:hypothetical protein